MTLKPNTNDITQFYQLIHNTADTELRCIHPHTGKVISLWGSLDKAEYAAPVEKLNNEGYGIYLVINSAAPEVGQQRIQKDGRALEDRHISAITSLMIDMDSEASVGENWEKLENAPLPPSAIVQTSTEGKYQAYWIMADVPVELYRGLQIQLIDFFQSDPTCKNPSRVMRMPGFWHTKAEPILSRLLECEPDRVYTLAEFCGAFAFDPEFQVYTEAPVELPEGWQPAPGIAQRIVSASERHIAKIGDGEGRHNTLIWAAHSCHENRLPREQAEGVMAAVTARLPPRASGDAVPLEEALDVLAWVYQKAVPGAPWADKGETMQFTVSAPGASQGVLSYQEVKALVDSLPSDPEQAMEKAIKLQLWGKIAQLTKAEQEMITIKLKKHAGISNTSARAFVREEKEQEDFTPAQLRDIVLEAWQTAGRHVRYIAEWQEWYVYQGGVYRQTYEETMLKLVTEILEAAGQDLQEYMLKDVLAKISRAPGVFQEFAEKHPSLLNVKNGLLDVDTLELTLHTPDIVTFAQAETIYDPSATCPQFQQFLNRFVPDLDHQATLQEFSGYAMTSHTFLQKCLYLKGPGGTGKGTFVSTLMALLSGDGDNAHGMATGMDIEGLNDNSPSLVNALNKRLVYISEVPSKANWLGWKRITGEDSVVLNPKYKRPYSAKLEAKILITANTWIHTGDDNSNNSIDRRLIILPMEIQPRHDEYDPNIVAKLTTPEELAGILNWAMRGWKRLKENHYRFTISGDKQRRLEFLENSNPVITFLHEGYEFSPGNRIQSSELYAQWKTWCEGEEVNMTAGQINKWGDERERWRRQGGSGHYTGTQKSFTAKVEEAGRVLEWKIEKEKTRSGAFWIGLARKEMPE